MAQGTNVASEAPTLPPAEGSVPRTARATVPSPDIEDLRQGMTRASRLGMFAFPLFFPMDLFLALAVHPEASIATCAALRGLGTVFLWLINRLIRRPNLGARGVLALHLWGFIGTGVLLSLFAVQLGGLRSEHLHGLSVIFIIQAAVVPVRWQLSLRTTVPVLLTYLVVQLGWAAYQGAPELQDARVMASLTASFLFVSSLGAIAAIASHAMWQARRQIYEARKLGRYRLAARIGQGGMNEIWLAWDETLRRDVALKILRGAEHDEAAIARFEREARAASRLRSPHTIQIYEFGASDDGIYYIAMEYLPGADLGMLVREHGPMPAARAVRFVRAACLSLAEAHEAGIVHRDIKPHNLFATSVGDDPDFLKLLDFGIARVVDTPAEAATVTHAGVLRGTPAYMSPEVCKGGNADARSDIYSLGATLYFLLAGAPPFDAASGGNLLLAHLTEEPLPPSVRRGSPLPPDLEAVVLRCLAKEPADRYASARELYEALGAAIGVETWTLEEARAFWTRHRPSSGPPTLQSTSLREDTVAAKPTAKRQVS